MFEVDQANLHQSKQSQIIVKATMQQHSLLEDIMYQVEDKE